MEDVTSTLPRDLLRVTDNIQRQVPFGRYQFVTVTMPDTVGAEVTINHTLNPNNPRDVGYVVVQQNEAGIVYHDTTATRRKWTPTAIYLRCTVSALRCTLLLFVPTSPLTQPTLTGTATGPSTVSIVTAAIQPYITTCANLTTVGALNAGSITSGFGSINVGTDGITGGAISGTQLRLAGPYDINNGILKIQPTNGDNAGLTLFYDDSAPNASSRAWQIAANYTAYGNLEFLYSASNSTNPTTSAVSIDSAGNVGIGSTAQAAKLAINGGLHVGGTTDPGDNNALIDGTLTATGAFGCNTKAAQTAYASGGALAAYGTGAYGLDSGANMSALHALVVKIRAALVANGIMS